MSPQELAVVKKAKEWLETNFEEAGYAVGLLDALIEQGEDKGK